ncbi:carbamoyl transferase [Oscillatoriales cyanobacterium LEGE 11467]|uniref:Carbamoyl transferase n=1 Tax=Zarconia navalis LEGE 11467 TaxID=1828826 RepID=A0A928Z674_9CYAN|nr:carbamoyltransferase C-terminal domain-containing protein [Zarconia navalis]MBE9040072.1 carbamoyl transferase [Zarconia navalis LEGE 11467]
MQYPLPSPRPSYILGINSAYHESSVCLIRNGKIVLAIEEERLNRVKHAKPARVDNPDELPVQAIQLCLEKAGITWKEIDRVGYSFDPVKRLKNKEYSEPVIPGDWGSADGEKLFYEKLQQVPQQLSQLAREDITAKFEWLDHHLCHAASAYFVSPYQDAAVLVVDGIGEFESTTFYHGKENRLEKLNTIDYPNSLGFLWEKFAQFLGFSEYDACKVMGLASYGNFKYYDNEFRQILTIEPGSFQLDPRILQFRVNDFSQLEKLFGPRREPGSKLEERHMDIAATLQKVTEEVLLELANDLYDRTGSENLCLAGGVALNCVANRILQEKTPYKHIYIQPAANDAGTAIGAAYEIWHQILGQPRSYVMDRPYLGPEYSDVEIQAVLDEHNLDYHRCDNIEEVAAKLVADGHIVGWFQDRMEMGPRALGSRTLLADPRNPNMRDILNIKVKHREHFRPFAPSVLADKAQEWFRIGDKQMPSDFMLFAYEVLESKRDLIPAVIHIDGTSRVQTVRSTSHAKYYRLIEEFDKLTGVPIVLNTSFNDSEPIVCSPEDAVETFGKTKIDYLAIGNFLVSKGECA